MVNEKAIRIQRQHATAVREIFAAECQRCGACCIVHTQEPFNINAGSDTQINPKLIQIGPRGHRGSNRYLRITRLKDRQFTGGAEFKKCAALQGSLRNNVSCSVYAVRPECCSNYDPGSPACIESRRWASMEDPEDLFWVGRS